MSWDDVPYFIARRIGDPNEEECHPWMGHIERGGYGRITTRQAPWSPDGQPVHLDAHRVIWEIVRERTIPDGLWLDHWCHRVAVANGTCGPPEGSRRNPRDDSCPHRRCVWPWHLEPAPRGVLKPLHLVPNQQVPWLIAGLEGRVYEETESLYDLIP